MLSIQVCLKPARGANAEVTQVYKDISRVAYNIARSGGRIATEVFTNYVYRTFETEGFGHWAELTDRTNIERIRLGFPWAHPILIRTGKLMRSLTTSIKRSTTRHSTRNITFRLATTDDRFERLQEGDLASNLPPRPMVPESREAQQHVCKLIEQRFVDAIDQYILGS